MKPYLFAATLAIILCVGSAPAEAQLYGGGGFISIGGPSSFVTVGSGPVIAPPIVSPYSYLTPTSRVIVQPAPIVTPLPYRVYRPGWGPGIYGRPYGVYGRPYGGVYGRPYGVYGRRGWW